MSLEIYSVIIRLIAFSNNTYLPCNPVAIKIGQLVEVQASFCVVPIAKGKFIMLHKLRSICILSAQVQEVRTELINTAELFTDILTTGHKRSTVHVCHNPSIISHKENQAQSGIHPGGRAARLDRGRED